MATESETAKNLKIPNHINQMIVEAASVIGEKNKRGTVELLMRYALTPEGAAAIRKWKAEEYIKALGLSS